MKIVMAGGGTGGHLFPAIALAEELRGRDPSTSVTFVGSSRGLEAKIVPSKGYELVTFDVEGIKKRSGLDRLRAVWKAASATWKSLSLLKRISPDVVIGSGGYSSGPVVLAAWMLGIKTAILEQNARPGLTNKLLGKVADRIYTSFGDVKRFFPAAKVVQAGNPVRKEILGVRAEAAKGKKFTLFVFGGSQGATAINAAFLDAAEHLSDIWAKFEVVHQTGEAGFDKVKEAYERKNMKVKLFKFIDDMAWAYSVCDLAVCRAGATSIAEMAIVGAPSVMVPYPFAADSHQDANADEFERAGAAVVIRQDRLTGASLAAVIRRLAESHDELEKMRQAAKKFSRPQAAKVIVDDIVGFIKSKA